MVQNVDCIHTQLELFTFRKLHLLCKVHIESDVAWPLDPFQSHGSQLSRFRIHEKCPALRVRDGSVTEKILQRLLRRHCVETRIGDLLQGIEVRHAVRQLRYLSHAFC